jgi:hypothetical protein
MSFESKPTGLLKTKKKTKKTQKSTDTFPDGSTFRTRFRLLVEEAFPVLIMVLIHGSGRSGVETCQAAVPARGEISPGIFHWQATRRGIL